MGYEMICVSNEGSGIRTIRMYFHESGFKLFNHKSLKMLKIISITYKGICFSIIGDILFTKCKKKCIGIRINFSYFSKK